MEGQEAQWVAAGVAAFAVVIAVVNALYSMKFHNHNGKYVTKEKYDSLAESARARNES